MTLFADASALVAILTEEPDGPTLTDRLESHERRLCSALSVWETVAALCHRYSMSVAASREDVARYVDAVNLLFIPIGEAEYAIAADAYARFGKGRHPAALNMGDCFSYACARANGARLLFKGNDFARTDIAPA